MIDETLAKKQVMRIGQMRGFPKDIPEAMAELVKAVMKAPNEEIAKAVMADFVDGANAESVCPFPSDIKTAIAEMTNKVLGEVLPDPKCPKCEGIGWIYKTVRDETGVDKCDCWARRQRPVYPKRGDADGFKEQIARVAEAKRDPGDREWNRKVTGGDPA
jgi:hypothetical protein